MTDENLNNGAENKQEEVVLGNNVASTEKKAEDLEEEKLTPVSFLGLFRFSTLSERIMMITGLFFAMGQGSIQPIVATLLSNVVDSFIQYAIVKENVRLGNLPEILLTDASNQLRDDVTFNVLLFVGLGAAAGFCAYISRALWTYTGEKQAQRIRRLFLESVLKQDVEYFDVNKTGDLTTRLSSDTSVYQEGVSEKVAMFVFFSSTFIAGFVVAFIEGWLLTLIMLATVPFLGVAGAIVGKAISDASKGSADSYAKAGAIAQEAISQIRTVTAFRAQPKVCSKFEALVDEARAMNEKKSWRMGIGFGVFFGMLYGVYALAFYAGSRFVVQGRMQGGEILGVLFGIIIGAFSIIGIAPSLQSISKSQGVAAKLYQVIDNKPRIVSKPGADSGNEDDNKDTSCKIEFKNVSFAYPSRPGQQVLKNFSLVVEGGQTVALVGLSGSGKSTIVQLLERFYDLPEDGSQGQILIDDKPIRDWDLKKLRQSIGLVQQEPILFDATIYQNIFYGQVNEGKERNEEEVKKLVEQSAKEANADDFIRQLPQGYQTRVGERGSLLSGGQKQRIAIARALMKHPRLLLLDEATSALDTESERMVQQTLDQLQQSSATKRTTITIAHRLSTIQKSDLIVVMEGGEIKERGKHEDLVALKGLYTSLTQLQQLNNKMGDDSPVVKTAKDDQVVRDAKVVEDDSKELKQVIVDDQDKPDQKAPTKQYLGRILKMQSNEWSLLILGVVGATANGALLPVFGLIFGRVLTVFQETDPNKLLSGADFWSLIFMVLMFLNFFANCAQFGGFGVAGERLTMKIRVTMFAAMLRQEIQYFDEPMNSTGALTTRLSDEAEKIQLLTGPTAGTLMQLLVSIGVSLGAAFYYSWQMTLCVLAVIPLLVLAGYLENKVQFEMQSDSKAKLAYAQAAQTACDAIANIRTVKSLQLEHWFVEEYERNLQVPFKMSQHKAFISSLGYGFSQAMGFWIYAITFYIGYLFVRQGILAPGDLFTVLFCIVFGAISLSQAASYGIDVSKARAASQVYCELVDRQPLIDPQNPEGLKPDPVKGTIEFKDISFIYPQRPEHMALRKVSFRLDKPGMSLALVGPSGSGKSTIVQLLLRFYDPKEGKILVDDSALREWNLAHLRTQMSIVSQEPFLFSGTIKDNILFGVDASKITDEQIQKVANIANIQKFISTLPDQMNTEISNTQLSGGQKQRIAIARALIGDPKILLLDEATSALDSESEHVVQQALMAASNGRTTITIAHRLSTIQNSDLILVFKDGEIVETGQHQDLLRLPNGLYASLVQKQKL